MKHRITAVFAGAVLIALLMGSCDALFTNQFKAAGLGQPTAADIAAQAASSDPAIAQPALSLQVEAKLDAGGAAPVVENLVGVLIDNPDQLKNMTGSSADMNTVLTGLGLNDPAKVESIIDSILGTKTELDKLAGTVTGDSFAASGLDSQKLATTAALATVLDKLTPADPTESVGKSLADFVAAYQAAPDPSTVNISTYVTTSATFGDDIKTALTDSNSTVGKLLLVAGIDVSTMM